MTTFQPYNLIILLINSQFGGVSQPNLQNGALPSGQEMIQLARIALKIERSDHCRSLKSYFVKSISPNFLGRCQTTKLDLSEVMLWWRRILLKQQMQNTILEIVKKVIDVLPMKPLFTSSTARSISTKSDHITHNAATQWNNTAQHSRRRSTPDISNSRHLNKFKY